MLSAWLVAYAIFCAGVALRSRRVPRALRELGRISYSVYLVQALVLLAVPPLSSAALTIVVWAGSVLGISVLTHRFVELPAVALGRRWAGSVSRPAAASAARSPAAVIAAVPVIPAAAFPAAVPAPRHPTTPSVRELTRT
jgi:peptidoglycan/LPS O-acetylase OafA/YrhL